MHGDCPYELTPAGAMPAVRPETGWACPVCGAPSNWRDGGPENAAVTLECGAAYYRGLVAPTGAGDACQGCGAQRAETSHDGEGYLLSRYRCGALLSTPPGGGEPDVERLCDWWARERWEQIAPCSMAEVAALEWRRRAEARDGRQD